jgi:hypothetical protein
MSAEKYISNNRHSLLSIYSQVMAVEEFESSVFNTKITQAIKKEACKKSIVIHKYMDGDIEYPISVSILKPKDNFLVEELYSVMLCEEFVKDGKLIRDGDFYEAIIAWDFKSVPKFKKYIKVK